MKDFTLDKVLKIQTSGRDDYKEDNYHHAYEPTPYMVLERIAKSEYITTENTLIDYGCGKGRVDFYLSHELGCHTIGIEYDERMYEVAVKNQETYHGKCVPDFVCTSAENYIITDADCFYFFNPFTVEILRSVMGRILDSYFQNPRHMTLMFYYPDDEYVTYLMTKEELMFVDEISCEDLFEGNNNRERILIFEIIG